MTDVQNVKIHDVRDIKCQMAGTKMTDVRNEKIRDVRKRKEAMFIITLFVFFLFPNIVFHKKIIRQKQITQVRE